MLLNKIKTMRENRKIKKEAKKEIKEAVDEKMKEVVMDVFDKISESIDRAIENAPRCRTCYVIPGSISKKAFELHGVCRSCLKKIKSAAKKPEYSMYTMDELIDAIELMEELTFDDESDGENIATGQT